MSVRKLKLGEYGRVLAVDAGVDISTADSYAIEFTKPDRTVVEVTAELGIVELIVDDKDGVSQTYAANEYVTYTIEAGLIDQTGRWTYRLLAPSASLFVPGECGSVEVES